jgi:phage-related protein
MKKSIIVLGAIAIVSLMISTATAVPQVHSEPVMNIVNDVEQKKTFFYEKIEGFSEKIALDVGHKGIIDTIIAIIQFIINLIMEIIQFIADLMQLGNLILALIDAITALISIITQFIEWIMGILNPEDFAFPNRCMMQ